MTRDNIKSSLKLAIVAMFLAFSTIAHANPYAGLLPKNFKVESSPTALTAEYLRDRKVAIVLTDRSEKYIRKNQRWMTDWAKSYPMVIEEVRRSLDPKQITDPIFASLQRHTSAIQIFADLASAREAGAETFIILDFSGGFKMTTLNPFSSNAGDWQVKGGVYVLDQQLRKMAEFLGEGRSRIDVNTGASKDVNMLAYLQSTTQAQNEFSSQIVQKFDFYVAR